MNLLYKIFGGCRVSVPRCDAEKLLNICMHYRFVYKNMRTREDCISFECSMYTYSLLESVCRKYCVCLRLTEKYGLPELLYRYKKRVGILVGVIVAAAIIIISERYVWDIRITGCENIDADAVIEALGEQNFKVGSYIPNADIDVIENRVLINSGDIAWISINMKGSVAYVEIRESVVGDEGKSRTPANLVAAWDGQIEAIESSDGRVVVSVGQHVRRGELLVSGVFDSNAWGYRYVRASGEVLARTVRDIHIEIPLAYEEKCYSEEEYSTFTLFFFSKELKLYRNTGFLGGTYDTICNVVNLCLFDGTRLPAILSKTTYRLYTYEPAVRDHDAAMALAYEELERQIGELTESGAELLRKSISFSITDDMYILDCTLNLIENIAEVVEFEVIE